MAKEPEKIKTRMLTHLQEIMEDGQYYGWLVVKSYHMAWLQHLVQSRAM